MIVASYESKENKRKANVITDSNSSRYYSVVMLDEDNKIIKKTHCNYDIANDIAREFIERN